MATTPSLISNATPYLVEHAKSVVVILAQEFGTPFVLYEAATGSPLPASDECWQTLDLPVSLRTDTLAIEFDEPRVVQRAVGCFEIWIPLREGSRTILVAATLIHGFSHTKDESEQERLRLSKWVASVRGRLEQATQSNSHRKSSAREEQAAVAWESLITLEGLMRRTRFLSDSEANHRRILKGLAELLGADAVIWVPQAINTEVILVGDCRLSVWDCRQFAGTLTELPDFEQAGMLLENDVRNCDWSRPYPAVGNLLAVQVVDQRMPGCLIVVNKREKQTRPKGSVKLSGKTLGKSSLAVDSADDSHRAPLASFRRSDAALLTPFLTLMSTQFRAANRHQELKDLLVSLTRSLTASIDAKDPYTMGHSERVGRIAAELARELGMKGEELSDIYLAGLLHDIGKIGIKDAVLLKQGPLTPEETEHIQQHVTIGYQILSDVRAIKHLLPGVLYHHERYDGKGYPHKLEGEAIPFLARILAVADTFDAMHTNRPYRPALSINRVEEIFREGAGSQWDPQVVDAFFRCKQHVYAIRQRGVGESLRHALDHVLKDGSSIGSVAGRLPSIPLPA